MNGEQARALCLGWLMAWSLWWTYVEAGIAPIESMLTGLAIAHMPLASFALEIAFAWKVTL